MLILTMVKNQTIEIGDSVRITVLSVSEDEVGLGVEAPMDSSPSGPQASTEDAD